MVAEKEERKREEKEELGLQRKSNRVKNRTDKAAGGREMSTKIKLEPPVEPLDALRFMLPPIKLPTCLLANWHC